MHLLSLKEEVSLGVLPTILLLQPQPAYLVRVHLQVEMGSLEANQMLLLLRQAGLGAASLVVVR